MPFRPRADRRRDAARDALLGSVEWAVERVTYLDLEESPDGVDARLRRWFVEPVQARAA